MDRFHVYAVNDRGEKRNIALAPSEERAIGLVQSFQCAWPDWNVTYDTKAKPLEEFAGLVR